jgi:hypothetical protein
MFDASNVYTSRFYDKISAICGESILIEMHFNRLSPEIIRRGQKLVKTALYHIRRALASGNRSKVSYADTEIVELFATRENVEEILNLICSEAFLNSSGDRGLFLATMKVLGAYVQPEDLPRLLQFQEKIAQIKYYRDESNDIADYDDVETYAEQNARWHRYDREEFQRVLTAAGATV